MAIKRILAGIMAVALIGCVAACGKSDSSSERGTSESTNKEELSGKYKVCDKDGKLFQGFSYEFNDGEYELRVNAGGKQALYSAGNYEVKDGKLIFNPRKLTAEEVGAINGEKTANENQVNAVNDRIMNWFDGECDYEITDKGYIYTSCLDEFMAESLAYYEKSTQQSADSQASRIAKAAGSAFMDAEADKKLPRINDKKKNVVLCSDASKTVNCDGLNDVLLPNMSEYCADLNDYEYIVVLEPEGYADFAVCRKKGDERIGYFPVMKKYYGKNLKEVDVSGMTFEEIYELVTE